jgi:hypothetical protein
MNAVVVICLVLLAIGGGLAVRWGHLPWVTPWEGAEPDTGAGIPTRERARRALWFVDVLLIAAITTGVLVVGAGGRLVMRLLAVTAGDAAQGRLTEAEEVVGKITVSGTIGFVLFVGLGGGLVIAALFAVLRKWLPAGRRGALALAAFGAVLLSTRLDPLRPNNPDFDLVGPGWLAAVSFLGLIALAFLTFFAVAAWASGHVPLVSADVRALAAYLPVVMLLPVPTGLAVVTAASAVAIAFLAQPWFRGIWSTRAALVAGRLAIATLVVALVPAFVKDVIDVL